MQGNTLTADSGQHTHLWCRATHSLVVQGNTLSGVMSGVMQGNTYHATEEQVLRGLRQSLDSTDTAERMLPVTPCATPQCRCKSRSQA